MNEEKKKYKVIGMLGGMGPLATIDLFDKIVRLTKADADQEHLPIVIVNWPQVPDRTEAILKGGEDPTDTLLMVAAKLKAAGADFMIVPCNNSHVFLKRVNDRLPLPLLSMIDITADRLKEDGVKVAGILATSGTLAAGLYKDALIARGIEPLEPHEKEQAAVMHVIYDVIKAGRFNYDPKPIKEVISALQERGATRLILGCTELPLAVRKFDLSGPFIDPTLELAKAAVREAGGVLADDMLRIE